MWQCLGSKPESIMKLEHKLWQCIFELAKGQLEDESQILSEFLDFAMEEIETMSEEDNKWFEQGN